MTKHDLVIKGATLVDGTGSVPRIADVAVANGIIVETGQVTGVATRTIDGNGLLVTPGFVDIHTHYDGQATWDSALAPSSWHGVTTVVAGNCGVGFAPVHKHDRERLIQLMEGVEDIPGTALHEGLSWEWESFGDYLNFLDRRPRDIDLAVQLPHAAVRLHVMGDRGAKQEPATADDIARMRTIARDAMRAGALGFSTSRTINHKSSLGEPTPTLKAEADELIGIAMGLADAGAGVLQAVSDFFDRDAEVALFHEMARSSGRRISVSIVQTHQRPDDWRVILDSFAAATAKGVTMRGQVGARAIGLMFGLQATLHPFMNSVPYQELLSLPMSERLVEMRLPEVRQRIIEGVVVDRNGPLGSAAINRFENMFKLGDIPNYEPTADQSVAAVARGGNMSPFELVYDWLMEDDGAALLYMPAGNFAGGNLDAIGEMLNHSASVSGLSDGGAHVGTICDVSFPTTLLQWWGRDRPYGRLPIELLVAKQTRLTAETVGLLDRGVVAPGYRADLNVIDFNALRLYRPEIHHDLPAGGRRLLQRADGYRHTFVSGVEIMSDGSPTGATPGRLIRGAQLSPGR
jgi:N-acyl-D-aspartate/D-glutamate deacylase